MDTYQNTFMQTRNTMHKIWFFIQLHCDKVCVEEGDKCTFSKQCPYVGDKERKLEINEVTDCIYLKSIIIGNEMFKDLVFDGDANQFFGGLTVGSFIRLSSKGDSMFVNSHYVSSFVVDESKDRNIIKLVKGE